MNRLPALLLVLIAVLMTAAGCRSASFPAAAAVEPPVPTLTVQVLPSATEARQPSATLAPAATASATVPPAPAAQLEPTPAFTPRGDSSLPEPCRPSSGHRVYTRSEDAFCFSMPERFEVETSSPGYARIAGPALEQNADPIRVTLEITAQDVRTGRTLTGLVDKALAEFADFTAWEIRRIPTEIGGEPAVVVEPIPGLLSGRALYFLHGGAFYKLYFWPVDIELAQSDLVELYETTTGSLHFLSEPAASAAATGKSIAGRVVWGLAPVPGGRVELRRPDWRTHPDSPIMKTEADSEGSYLLVDPPVGEYEVVPAWPEGVTDGAPLAPGAPVTVAAGQEVAGIDVYLAKRLPVLEPAVGAEVSATPTLRWEAVPNARLYRVIITDFATMEGFYGEDVTGTSVDLATPLPAGRKLTLVINALGEAMSLLAVDSREFGVK